MKEIQEKIKELQKINNALGPLYKAKSSNSIANFLKKKNIKGYIGEDESCPIANYLHKECPKIDWSVNTDGISMIDDNSSCSTEGDISINGTIKEFIEKFDFEKYPELIKE